MVNNALANKLKNQWLAELQLEFSHNQRGTVLSKTTRKGPLSVQKAFYPEGPDCAHIYLLHPPAGIVSGDELRVTMTIQDNAHMLVTTPGANRFYRAREDLTIGDSKQTQITTFHLANQAKGENLPQETIVYEGADGFNTVDIHMTKNSVYLGWDITCLGLPHSAQPFNKGRYTQLNRLFCDDQLIYHDRIAINPENHLLTHSAGLASRSVFATFLAYAPDKQLDNQQQKKIVTDLREKIEQAQATEQISITNINGLIVIRYLGENAQQCKNLFITLWQYLRPLFLDKTSLQPRIWHT